MLQRNLLRKAFTSPASVSRHCVQRRTNVTIPKHSRGTIVSRDPERPLPPLPVTALWRWGTTMPIFIAVMCIASAAIFNYEKTSSSVVNSTLYALRTNPEARRLLGDEIYFRDRIPWVWGQCNSVKGRYDICFAVKGTKETGYMRFRSFRQGGALGKYITEDWSLELSDGRVVQLLDEQANARFQTLAGTS